MTNAANEQARLLKQAIEAEEKARADRAAESERSRGIMGLLSTIRFPFKSRPKTTHMGKRAYLWTQEDE